LFVDERTGGDEQAFRDIFQHPFDMRACVNHHILGATVVARHLNNKVFHVLK
jgi:hypothetical protein